MAALRASSGCGPTVVITHHAPTLRSLQGNPHAGTHMDAAYANRWEDIMGEEQMALWRRFRAAMTKHGTANTYFLYNFR